jgi:hypothetical protein
MDIEDYLGDLLERGAGESLARVDVDAVLRGGEHLGRRLRRRRRNRMVMGAAAAVVAVGVGTAAAIDHVEDTGHEELAATRPTLSATPAPTPTPSTASAATEAATAAPVSTPTSLALAQANGQKAVAMIEQLLPTGDTVTLNTYSLAGFASKGGSAMLINDGRGDVGTATIWVGAGSPTAVCTAQSTSADTGKNLLLGGLTPGCSVVNLAGGGSEVNTVTAPDAKGYYEIVVNVVRKDGYTVSFTVGNGVVGGPTAETVSQPLPPLTIAQADAVAQSTDWQPILFKP